MQAGEGISPKSGRRLTGRPLERKPGPEHPLDENQTVVPDRVRADKVTLTRPEEDRHRRTILIEKVHGSFGFTIQSYGIQYRRDSEVEIITYIDHVETSGPAGKAGMREGDVILSINGQDMEQFDHQALVSFIKQCPDRLRMVVLFEDCVRKVSLHMRYIQLQRQLTDRMYALEQLCEQEKHFIASLRAQGRRVPAFYPAQTGYCRGPVPVPQPPPLLPHHGPPPSYAEAIGRRPQPGRYLCYHRATPGRACGEPTRRPPPPHKTSAAAAAAAAHRWHHQQHWRGRGKSWDNLAGDTTLLHADRWCGSGSGGGSGGGGNGGCGESRPRDDRQVLLDSGFPALHRARAKAAKSAESLLAPGSEFDTSCFSCDCLRTFPGETSRRAFSKPKSVENLLLAVRVGGDSLRREKTGEKRRSSLKLCRKGSRSALVPAEDVSERSEHA